MILPFKTYEIVFTHYIQFFAKAQHTDRHPYQRVREGCLQAPCWYLVPRRQEAGWVCISAMHITVR